jgi:hypothetical protein
MMRLSRWVVTGFVLALVIGLTAAWLPANGNLIAARGNSGETSSAPVPEDFAALQGAEAVYANCRFGVAPVHNPITTYNTLPFNIGWYVNWRIDANPATPGGAEHVQTVRVGKYRPSDAQLAASVTSNAGAIWLIGNEPDRYGQDGILPQAYATEYYQLYHRIKGLDPSARVMVGGIVQPTPIRLMYLDMVLQAYVAQYGADLPADGWHTHNFILNEASCDAYPDACWGAEIPPGVPVDRGVYYGANFDLIDDLATFGDRLLAFRQWMKLRGYRNVPLLLTEYGTVLPYYHYLFYDSHGRPFDETRAGEFLHGTFDLMLNAADPDVGYPPDENRLVQRWLWYSLDDSVEYGGALFNRDDPSNRLALGDSYVAYTSAIAPAVDLVAVDVARQGLPVQHSANSYTVTLRARVANVGNVATGQPVTVLFSDHEGNPIQTTTIHEPLGGCAQVHPITVEWAGVSPGLHSVTVTVDPDNLVAELNENNNQIVQAVFVGPHSLMLPAVRGGIPYNTP